MADDRCQPLQGASPCGRGARGQRRDGPYKRGLNTKIHLAVDAHGMPVRILATEATCADCSHAGEIIEGLAARHLIADRGYDSDAIVEQARHQGMQTVIPPRRNSVNATSTCTDSGTWSRTHSCCSSSGGVSPRATRNGFHLFLPPPRFVASSCGFASRDDTV